jgi:hypothetical protein
MAHVNTAPERAFTMALLPVQLLQHYTAVKPDAIMVAMVLAIALKHACLTLCTLTVQQDCL